jgi:hypothetical protein
MQGVTAPSLIRIAYRVAAVGAVPNVPTYMNVPSVLGVGEAEMSSRFHNVLGEGTIREPFEMLNFHTLGVVVPVAWLVTQRTSFV